MCVIAMVAMLGTTLAMAGPNGIGKDVSNQDYYDRVRKLKSNNTNVDFQALRRSYTKTQDYKPYGADDNAKDAAINFVKDSRLFDTR